ncbi:hypothetical protein [Scatolibacter rhodanostii]|uniref:hypothetical protein n=1 Tax=Scatolibacter rhodanostii TaxID=2014781 RepID=UPI000C077163|nr:hypothetical protein [Scatolibacter rhodanostii]
MDDKQLNEILRNAAQKLGTSADQLKEMALNGNLEKQINNSIDGPSQEIKKMLNDPETARKLLSTPEAQEVMKWLNQRNNGK